MPIETLDDIIDELADGLGIYGCGGEEDSHKDDCDCRVCFEVGMRIRIFKAIELEMAIARGKKLVDDLPDYIKSQIEGLSEESQ